MSEYYVSKVDKPPEEIITEDHSGDEIPVIWVGAGSTKKQTLLRLLNFMGIHPSLSHGVEGLSAKLRRAVRDSRVRFIVLDDLQNLQTHGGRKAATELKTLMEELSTVTFLFTTTDLYECPAMTGVGSAQTLRRTTWVPVQNMKQTSKLWRSTLDHFETTLPLCFDREAGPMLEPLSEYLHERTAGSMGTLAQVLLKSSYKLIVNNKITDERITRDLLDGVRIADDQAPPKRQVA